MKTRITVAAILVMIISFVVLGFVNKKETKKEITSVASAEAISTGFENTILKSAPVRKLTYFVRGANNKTITEGELSNVKTLKAVFEHYPTSWIEEYVFIEITRVTNSKEIKEVCKSIVLNTKQQALIRNAKFGDDIRIKIVYKTKNAAKNSLNTSEIKKTLTIVPDISACFKGAENALESYLTNNSSTEIKNWKFNPTQSATATFMIDENGDAINVNIVESSGIISIDKAIKQLLEQMPKWKPAKNSKGKSVQQKFELTIGDTGC
ncbi:energy transducer TonB [Tenacibaculum sp. AHE15PA]|uniref:energy transducer TonB n=1 Tax=unclassified Tenacibaculum TaxID=2635139 RepID=UPI001C4EE048|nr:MULTISPECIES: energy transducer TonB [unclassified Tenacibaculum]QXP73537.1 energy transducer TonB [Tenacibaculum sp. AHE14PA]QXP75051.1 energy transducer TonB [Tenacibaculum sp. AHE15PA]